MEDNTNREKEYSAEMMQYLTFCLSKKLYGLQILNIKEIIEYGELTEVPMTPAFISGVINLRGRVVPVIDLGNRFSGVSEPITKRTSIVIVEVKTEDLELEIGITVDLVSEVIEVSPENIEPSPNLGEQIETQFISGMAKVDGKFLILLDIQNIMSTDELSLVGGIQNKV